MYIVTASRKKLKDCYKSKKDNVALNEEKKIDVDLEPIIKLFSKIYTQSEIKSTEI